MQGRAGYSEGHHAPRFVRISSVYFNQVGRSSLINFRPPKDRQALHQLGVFHLARLLNSFNGMKLDLIPSKTVHR